MSCGVIPRFACATGLCGTWRYSFTPTVDVLVPTQSQLPIPYLGIVHDVRPLAPERTERPRFATRGLAGQRSACQANRLVDPRACRPTPIPPSNRLGSSTAIGSRSSDRESVHCRSFRPGHFTVQVQLTEAGLLVCGGCHQRPVGA